MNFKIKKVIFIFSAFLFLAMFGMAENTWAATLTAASCNLADVQAAVNNAARGDTVIVPAGTCTWDLPFTSALNITKAITLQGAGIGQTNITAGTVPTCTDCMSNADPYLCASRLEVCQVHMIKYAPADSAADANVLLRITGFTFNQERKSNAIWLFNYGWDTPLNKFRIDHNAFLRGWSSEKGWSFHTAIYHYGNLYGVIDNNTFTGSPKIIIAGAYKYTWNNLTYKNGTDKQVYIEDNTIIKDEEVAGAVQWVAFDSEGGGSYVARYNTLSSSIRTWTGWFDVHGNAPGVYGAGGGEIYGNKLTNTGGYFDRLFHLRAGRTMFMYNLLSTVSSGYNSDVVEEYHDSYNLTNHKCPSGTPYPDTYTCASDGQPQSVFNTYIWNNRNGISLIPVVTDVSATTPTPVRPKENTDFWKDNISFNGMSGIGCGTLANIPTTCTTGVGYWATNQSCAEVPEASVGKNPAAPISGTLYKCTAANVWTAYYTPYTYPHPLRGGTTNTAPAVPTGMRVV